MDSSTNCSKTYMPRLAKIYTAPFDSASSLSFYSAMISYGMSLMWMRMYSGCLIGVMSYKFDMSIVMNLAPFVDMMLLKRILDTSISAVGVATFPWVVYSFSVDCESCPVLFFFLWLHAEDELPVCHVFLAIFWNVLPSDECDCVV